ncbi:unnamed protein product [Boreogadus saida]
MYVNVLMCVCTHVLVCASVILESSSQHVPYWVNSRSAISTGHPSACPTRGEDVGDFVPHINRSLLLSSLMLGLAFIRASYGIESKMSATDPSGDTAPHGASAMIGQCVFRGFGSRTRTFYGSAAQAAVAAAWDPVCFYVCRRFVFSAFIAASE